MKKIYVGFIIIISVLALFIINNFYIKNNMFDKSSKEENYNTYTTTNYLSPDIREQAKPISPSTVFAKEYTSSVMYEESDAIIIGSIISVDGIDSSLDYAVGTTYGKMVVNNVISGSLEKNTIIEYVKSGAIMSLEEWEKNQPEESRKKREEMRQEAGIDASKIYYTYHYSNDPIVEEGKTYLIYIKKDESINKYIIIGREKGFRELDIKKSKEVTSRELKVQNYRIKNNETGEYESLNDYIDKNINSLKK